MDFIHHPYQPGETIAAVATPPGEGGVAVIRISGREALSVAAKVFSGPIHTYRSHTAHVGKILGANGRVIDEVLALVMREPRSYTGEDTVEIHCHGGSLITRRVLETILSAGARAAQPGEFTFKAFTNGKIDLAQAEAVQELISAKNELALDLAEQQLEGALSNQIKTFQRELVDIAAILEAWVDFPEEGLEFASQEEVLDILSRILEQMRRLADTFHQGRMISHGLSLCLAGPPNVGKSSLMNALLGKDRAIVTDIPGTTRDLLEEDLSLRGLHFRLIDTAGIRKTEEMIEKEGIRRSKEAMKRADLILLVMDLSSTLSEEAEELLTSAPRDKSILVWNKADLSCPATNLSFEFISSKSREIPDEIVHFSSKGITEGAISEKKNGQDRGKILDFERIEPKTQVIMDYGFLHAPCVSAKTGLGIEKLHACIDQMIWRGGLPAKDEIVITKLRHSQALCQAIKALELLIEGLKTGVSPEFVSFEMHQALAQLGTIIGTNIAEDILTAIFAKFCIGK
jgi:tRNA modification GTPase